MANIGTSTEKNKVVTVTNPKIDAIAVEKLITARIALLLRAPFFGSLAVRLKLVNADSWLSTIATDGRSFYYNSEFVNKMSAKETEFGFGHEVLHLVYDTIGRRGDRDHQLFNIASDYCINYDLVEQKIGTKITTVPILYDTKYAGWSSEQVYDELMKNAKKISIADLAKMMLDEHLDDSGAGDDDGDGEGNKDGKGRPGKMTPEERAALQNEIREAVLSAAESVDAGDLPAGVRRLLHDMTNPQMNWREIIQQQIQSLVRSDYTWMRPSRRGWHMDAIMPGNNFATSIDVSVSIDASGSMSDDMLRDILSEVKGIMQSFDDFKLDVWSFDGDVYKKGYAQFTPDNIDDIDTWECHGGGGTTFEANWDFMKEVGIVPKLFIMFTDGYPGGGWGDPDYCDTLFVIHGTTSITAPFGDTAYYDLSKGK